jgi:type II secretory ATPase GspE/PulE/Tfp pilus assembly ATPase PilB-like protein
VFHGFPRDRHRAEWVEPFIESKTMNPDASVESTVPALVEGLIRQAEEAGASDIHLQLASEVARIPYRLDGVMVPVRELPRGVADRVVGRIKYLARLKTYQESLPQDGRIDRNDIQSRSDVRVSTYPAVAGEKMVLRLFREPATQGVEDLGFPEPMAEGLRAFIRRPAGLLLLTGPSGSGKTTTIYAALRSIEATGGRHIITVEDPVEQLLPGIMQTEVNEDRGLTFARAARHLLRQDPQVLVIGEIRDDETAGVAVRAALTGHLVISTLHAGSCRTVVERLFLMCADHHAVVSALEMIVNQRLVRRVCPACRGTGCEACMRTGYRGRLPVVEGIRLTAELKRRLLEQGPGIMTASPSLEDSSGQLLREGFTTELEIRRVLAD